MNRFVLVLGILFFLIFFVPVESSIADFTGSIAQQIPVNAGSSFYVRKIDSIWDENQQAWYYYYELMNAGGTQTGYICKFDYNFTVLLDGCDNVYTTTIDGGGKLIDWNTTHIVVYFPDGTNIRRSFFTKNDLTKTTSTVVTSTESESSVTSDGTFVYQNTTSPTAEFGITFCSATGDCADLFINANHFIDANKKYPRNLNWIYVPDTEEYYLFYTVSNGTDATGINYDKAYHSIYDANQDDTISGNQPKYLGYFQISTEDVMTNFMNSYYFSGTYWARIEGSLYAKYINGWIYWTYRSKEDNNQTLYFESIEPISTKSNQWLHLIKSSGQHINLTNYDNRLCQNLDNVCNTTAQSYSFDYIPSKNEWWVFYHQYNMTPTPTTSSTSGKGLNLMALKSYAICLCSDWINVSSCGYYISNQQKQIRVCNPDNCQVEDQYVDCTEPSPTLNQKKESSCDVCSTGKKKPQDIPESKCSISITIPDNATNIISNATWSISVSTPFSFTSEDLPNFYRLIVCNPTENCFDQEYYCSQLNVSQTWDYNNYYSGQIATAEFGISQASACKQVRRFLADIGWTEYSVSGQLCLYYNKTCGGWVCTSSGLNDYLQQENSDCSREPINATNICINGCENGRCLSESESKEGKSDLEQIAINIGSPVGQIFSFALTGMDAMFLSPDLKLLGAFIFTTAISLGIALLTKKKEGVSIGLIAGLFMTFFFMSRGYIPLWIGVLLAIPEIGFIILLLIPTSKVK